MDQQRDTMGKAKRSRQDFGETESLPTLFELPDRTPEHRNKQRHSAQVAVHQAHSGPPAGHVDPPSGNHSHLRPHGPTPPDQPNATLPGQHADWDLDHAATPKPRNPEPDDVFDPDTKLAA